MNNVQTASLKNLNHQFFLNVWMSPCHVLNVSIPEKIIWYSVPVTPQEPTSDAWHRRCVYGSILFQKPFLI